MSKDDEILKTILSFFKKNKVFEKKMEDGYEYASYSRSWIKQLEKEEKPSRGKLAEEAMSARTTKRLQDFLQRKYPEISCEAPVAEGLMLRFKPNENAANGVAEIDPKRMQCFDILNVKTGSAFEIRILQGCSQSALGFSSEKALPAHAKSQIQGLEEERLCKSK